MNNPFSVVPISHDGQKAHKGWNRPAIAAGATVYAVKFTGNNGTRPLFFAYAYLSQAEAEEVAADCYALWANATRREQGQHLAWNYKVSPHRLPVPNERKETSRKTP
jgi:hypothetical protein